MLWRRLGGHRAFARLLIWPSGTRSDLGMPRHQSFPYQHLTSSTSQATGRAIVHFEIRSVRPTLVANQSHRTSSTRLTICRSLPLPGLCAAPEIATNLAKPQLVRIRQQDSTTAASNKENGWVLTDTVIHRCIDGGMRGMGTKMGTALC